MDHIWSPPCPLTSQWSWHWYKRIWVAKGLSCKCLNLPELIVISRWHTTLWIGTEKWLELLNMTSTPSIFSGECCLESPERAGIQSPLPAFPSLPGSANAQLASNISSETPWWKGCEGRAERSLPGLRKGFHFIEEQAEAQHKYGPQRTGDQPSVLQ